MKLWLHARHGIGRSACRVPPLHHPGFPVVVCWSAKAGCTTVLKWFLHHTGLLPEALAFDPWPHRYRAEVLTMPRDRYVASCATALRRGGVEVVKVVRDPARRAVSSFIHFLRMCIDPEWHHGVDDWKRRVGLGRQRGLSFEQFLCFVMEQHQGDDPMDPHFRTQWVADWDRHIHLVIRLEDLKAGLADLESRHGLPTTDISAFSESHHHNAPAAAHGWPREAARFAATRDDLERFGTPPPDALLDEHATQLVREAFARDYDAYGHLYRPARAAAPQRRAAA